MKPAVQGVLLAAGESRRMGFPKPLLEIEGRTFVDHLARAMLEVVPRLIIVIGAHAERVRSAIRPDSRITIVENPDYSRGQLTSAKAGLRALATDAAAAMLHLIDHPRVTAATFRRIVDEYEHRRPAILIARYQGRRGHPVIFDRALFEELLAVPEDRGANAVVNRDRSRISYFETDDPGVTLDLDEPADLAAAGLSIPSNTRRGGA
jgi:molybdenum cofactor cytidylyltransferase